jgi:hypothetical protein
MTGASGPGADSMALVQPFPEPGRLVQFAYRELDLATSRQQDHLLPPEIWRPCRGHGIPGPARRRNCARKSGPGWRLS